MLRRRHFLQLLAATAAGLPFARRAAAQTRPRHALLDPGPVSVTMLGESLGLISGRGGNVVALNGPSSGLLVNAVDRPTSRDAPASTKRVEFLFNTDWHPEHTGLNLAVAGMGGQILAHEFTKQYLVHRSIRRVAQQDVQGAARKGTADEDVHQGRSMTFGGQTIEYAPLGQAHTDGDIYVFFRDANVLVVGDMMTVGKYPIADYTSGGWLGGLVTATKTLLDLAKPTRGSFLVKGRCRRARTCRRSTTCCRPRVTRSSR